MVGKVHGKVRMTRSVSKVVTANNSAYDLKEVRIFDGMGKIKLTLWDRFVNAVDGGMSYAFKNLSTRKIDGCICLCTGTSSVIEAIADLEVAGQEGGEEEDGSTTLLSATIKGIEVTIQRRCSSCHHKQKNFEEKSTMHRCEGCRLKQTSLSFSTIFGGKAAVSSEQSVENVVLTSSALSTYLRASCLASMFNDSESIEEIVN
ncbi:uncharacterized protein [Pseudorasbora parva]|uniref:uncharacterized protein n=1 Tax=Pseudorasbora parva TaxID=51549 RepID=UPI00351E45CB